MIRELILDTETTGLNPLEGHRVIEIAAVELIDHVPSKKYYHCYINPEREIPLNSQKIHNISTEMVKNKPVFKDIAHEFLEFIKNNSLIIHNAEFDIKFLNYELNLIGIGNLQNKTIDTLSLARSKYPGSSVSLDSLCKKFNIDTTERAEKGHGALIDCYLLSEVYLEILGGKQPNFDLNSNNQKKLLNSSDNRTKVFSRKNKLSPRLNSDNIENHIEFTRKINCYKLWNIMHKKMLSNLDEY